MEPPGVHANHVVEELSVLKGVSEETRALVNLSRDYLRVQRVEVGDGDDVTTFGGQIWFSGVVV